MAAFSCEVFLIFGIQNVIWTMTNLNLLEELK